MSGIHDPWTSIYSGGLSGGTNLYLQGNQGALVTFQPLIDLIDYLSVLAKSKIATIRSEKSAMSIADMFDMQLAMNKLSQGSEMCTSVISALQTSTMSIARNLKG